MNTHKPRALALPARLQWLVSLILVGFATGCVVPGGDTSVGVSYGVDYYEPYGYDYGGWGPGYRVGPPPRGGWRHDRPAFHGGPPPRPHTFRPPGPSHSMPSIPNHPRSPGPGPGGRHR
jgi:hypothetical protein